MSDTAEPVVAIVVAAGSGVRLGGEGPKALRLLAGRPLVSWSIDAMVAGGVTGIVLVVADGTQPLYAAVLADVCVPVSYVSGGPTRQASVALGLGSVAPEVPVVLVHDAARPLVPPAVVAGVIEAVRGGAEAVIPVVGVKDTIRQLSQTGSTVVDRAKLRAVQTPQGFRRNVLVAAHAAATGAEFTDDAAVCEAAGHLVTLVEGSRESLKVTEQVDLAFAEAVWAARQTRETR